MLVADMNYNLIYTQGDTFALPYCLDYELKKGDVAVLSIKRKGQLMLYSDIEAVGERKLQFVISAEDMACLPVGRYEYDLCIKFVDGRVYTTDVPRELRIVGVAHGDG